MLSIVVALALGTNVVLGAGTSTTRPAESTIEPSLTQIIATEATAPALSPVSNVKGAGFDRIVQIWLENTVGKPLQLINTIVLIFFFRILIRPPQTRTCNGWQVKASH